MEYHPVSLNSVYINPFLVCLVFYHFNLMNEKIHATSKLGVSPLFVKAENSYIRKYSAVCFPCSKTVDIPLFTVIPSHVLILSVLEGPKEKLN